MILETLVTHFTTSRLRDPRRCSSAMLAFFGVALLLACGHSQRPSIAERHTLSRAPADVALPNNHAAAALREWLRVYNLGRSDSALAFAARAYTASELADRPADVIARGQQLWRMNYGQMSVVRVDSSTPVAIEATVHEALTEAYGKVFVEVDTAPPHGITGVWLIPFVEPPPHAPHARLTTDHALADALSRYTERLANQNVFSGAVLVARRGSPLFARAFGPATRDPFTPNTLDTRFELASLSKLFTAVAVAQLVERGRLAFDTPISVVLPDYPNLDIARQITVEQLLTHTSGLPDFYRNGKFRQYEDSLRMLTDFWATFANDTLWSQPGARYDYSNSNYIVLGSMIERLSGLSFEEYVKRNIFEPTGMARTCYCEMGADHRATPYSRYTAGFGPTRRSVPDRWIEVPQGARRPGAPAGGGISTVNDLALFAAALLEHRLLGAAMTTRVLSARVPMDDGGKRAYGFEVYEWSGTRFIGHGGNYWGTMTQLDIYPDDGSVVVILSNNDASGGEAVRNWTRRTLTSR
ncbi:MAG: beta-lactamase family protein [Gemmatimonadota bacterium]|nr:beta-lactamase family protein [Gemmatimonadota bacterium]